MLDADVQLTVLPNGLRVATELAPHLYGVSLGVTVTAGSRHEPGTQAGYAHLLEHMLFKGTRHRSAAQIAEEMDEIGGALDAFTSKDCAAYSVRVLPEHLPRALDILADLLLRPRLDPADLELEKNVILEEHRSLEDAPEEWVHDLFAGAVWPKHPLGRPVIGEPAIVAAATSAELAAYHAARYGPERLILTAAGPLPHAAMLAQVEPLFGSLPAANADLGPEEPPPPPLPARAVLRRPLEQAHFCLGGSGPGERDPDRWAARMLLLVLGGGMSSRLFQEARERRGLCYSIAAELVSHADAGLWVVYADTSPERLEELRGVVARELQRLVDEGVPEEELERAKAQVRAATLLSLDSSSTRMARLARALLYHGRIAPLSELLGLVEAVTAADCRRVATAMFAGGEHAFAAIGPLPASRRRGRVAARHAARPAVPPGGPPPESSHDH